MMDRNALLNNWNPNAAAVNNGNLVGLPFDEHTAQITLIPVPWEVTTSYTRGTALAFQNIQQASLQLDLVDLAVKDAWKIGIYLESVSPTWVAENNRLTPKTQAYIEHLETIGDQNLPLHFQALLQEVNQIHESLNEWLYNTCLARLEAGKAVGLIGGEHSVPLGYLKALQPKYPDFGILQIDAHCDLRQAYEGFEYSHASIFYNAYTKLGIQKIVQVGIRDFCEAEQQFIAQSNGNIEVFFDDWIKNQRFNGESFAAICEVIIATLPQYVYISFDIDGLDPVLCPHTGTPVPGGLSFNEATFLLQKVVQSGRIIIGFDLCEVNGEHEWDGNVGARILYKLCNLMGLSQGLI